MSESLRGSCLIAGRTLRDPNFFKTVVLVVEHSDEGAMGLVINRPSPVSVSRALQGHFELPETEDLVFVGGPVEQNALFILHDSASSEPDDRPVVEGLYVGSSAEAFADVMQRIVNEAGDVHFRIFSGCAGWAPDQLEGELARNDWFVLPAALDLIFASDTYSVWDEALARFRKSHPISPGEIGNPDWN